jgi:hypothetical protein
MKPRWERWPVAVLAIAIVAPLAATRFGGLLIVNADGRALGYSDATDERLAMEYPSVAGRVDGPYVRDVDGKRSLLRLRPNADGVIAVERAALDGDSVEVEVDQADARRFRVPLRREHPRSALDIPMPTRLLIASDFEGQFGAFTALMQGNGVIDADLHWRFGNGHLVLVGDMADRGDNVLPLLWLIYRMEGEAQAAGGGVHLVLGNHDQMLLIGRTSYYHPKYFGTLRLSGESPQALWDERSELGRWLRSKPILLKVGNYLFVHGGVSPAVLVRAPSLADVDRHASAVLTQAPDSIAEEAARDIVWGRDGLLWYRGLAMALDGAPRSDAKHVARVLEHFGVRHIAIGHTLVQHVGSDYDGAVLRIDVQHAAGKVEGVLLEDGLQFRIDATGQRFPLQAAINLD